MAAWKCKECNKEMICIVTEAVSKTCTIGKNGSPDKTEKIFTAETIAVNFYCKNCNAYYEDHVKLKDIAYWEE